MGTRRGVFAREGAASSGTPNAWADELLLHDLVSVSTSNTWDGKAQLVDVVFAANNAGSSTTNAWALLHLLDLKSE